MYSNNQPIITKLTKLVFKVYFISLVFIFIVPLNTVEKSMDSHQTAKRGMHFNNNAITYTTLCVRSIYFILRFLLAFFSPRSDVFGGLQHQSEPCPMSFGRYLKAQPPSAVSQAARCIFLSSSFFQTQHIIFQLSDHLASRN